MVFESKDYHPREDHRLFLLLKLGTFGDHLTIEDLRLILEKVSIPPPDDEYSHLFTARTWVMKAIMRLSAYGIIRSRRLERMEADIYDIAEEAFDVHEQGRGWVIRKFEFLETD
ncbi:hypothetical protein Clacol_002650 [Clathrus columnatus]|uniref:Uncharacterized protein n=1 Tax=Clathrus columnatus TaxID=1419009 RepID=A0AAV5A5B0_9AGAM|nr:hypothetical protein Clacol_002650 [Clathrus columnatus]